ncbi:hypothetical protein MBLNU230_g3532t1 [Neophaeotheca triangularis]
MATPSEAVAAYKSSYLSPHLSDHEARLAASEVAKQNARLSLPLPMRLPVTTLLASVSGFSLGALHGGTTTSLRFRAENAHRLPDTQTGWYLYHKSKNYHVALGSLYEGCKMGFRLAAIAGLYVGMEEGVDRARAAAARVWRKDVKGLREGEEIDELGNMVLRPVALGAGEREMDGNRDFVSSVFAGLGTAGVFSAWNRFPVPTAARLARMGAKVGLGFGLLQDALGYARGRKLGYVESVKRTVMGRGKVEAGAESVRSVGLGSGGKLTS